jgi:predicted RNA-binding protein
MCEANAYVIADDTKRLILESVDLLEPCENGEYRLVNIFGEQRIVSHRLLRMNLVDHKILFTE